MSKIDFMSLKTIDFCDDVRDGTHDSPKHLDSGKLLITSKNIKGDSIDFENASYISEEDYNKINERSLVEINDVLYSMIGTVGLVYRVDQQPNYAIKNMGLFKIHDELKSKWLYYYLNSPKAKGKVLSMLSGSTQKFISLSNLRNLEIEFPQNIDDAKRIIKICESIDKKIKLNNEINNNLEEQLRLFFEEKILKQLTDENTYKCSLYDQFDVIDNRGKTPPLVEYSKYSIIDVKVLSGKARVINYSNCLKYVDEDTYNTFFRSGHPKIYDTLLSTVGSLAELKIYLENIGTIAQNVVALRPKNNFPLFMYQYVLSLRQKLTSYDIGSVQPSIKVTQFMKEMIRIPNDKELIYKFEQLAKSNTLKMKNLMMENRYLEQLRDTLLPKLMNGEIDLDNIEI